jgi:hypothetical protein
LQFGRHAAEATKLSVAGNNSFSVVEESLDLWRHEAIALLDATRRQPIDGARFDWLYRKNPDGEAVLWGIRKLDSGELAGFTAALPRRMMVEGQLRMAWNGADFSILPKFRALGPAIKLRRAAKEGIDAGRADFLYAHPNERMAVIHAKVGHSPVGTMLRFARPLKTGQYLEGKLRSRLAARALGRVADPLFHLAARPWKHRRTCEVRLASPASFGDAYDRLFEGAAPALRVVGVRDARYLNWRYRENPLYQPHALEAWDNGQLRGYLLLIVEDETVSIKDVFPPSEPAVVRDLIAALIRQGRRLGLKSLSVTALETNPLLPVFAEFAFRQRPETSQMFGYVPADRPWHGAVMDKNAWFLTVGDRDV